MPTTPTPSSLRGGGGAGGAGARSSPPRLPPPRHLSRTARLPPPSAAPLNFTMDDDPFTTNLSAAVEHGRHRARQNPSHLPPPSVSRTMSSSSDEGGYSRRTSQPEEEEMLPSWTGPVSGSVQPPMFYHTEAHTSVSRSAVHFGSEIEESSLDPVEAAQLQELVVGDPEMDEDDTGDTEEAEEVAVEEETAEEAMKMELGNPFDLAGLKEIGNLASWTVSTCKQGSGVEALRHDDTNLFWQSDGPQPHHLNIHFSRLVSILSIRIFLDFEADESYTPTKLLFLAGTGYHDLIPFQQLAFDQPKGWIDVPLHNAGGGPQGNELRCFLVQLRVVENHQNGKDTHVRGLKIYARDERQGHKEGLGLHDRLSLGDGKATVLERIKEDNDGGHLLEEPDWMGEPELR